MKQTRLPVAALLVLAGPTLTTCSKSSDPNPTPTPTPTGKTYTLSLGYSNGALDKATTNLGPGFRVVVDGKPMLLTSKVDTTYHLASFDTNGTIPFQDTFTFTGSKLTLEVGFYNIYGTVSQPKDKSGRALTIPANAYLNLSPTVNGVRLLTPHPRIGGGLNASLAYDNGKNPSRTITYDLTKL